MPYATQYDKEQALIAIKSDDNKSSDAKREMNLSSCCFLHVS